MNRSPLLLLHGAMGASAQFAPLVPLLEESLDIHLMDFEGHGQSPPRDRPFRIEHFAENVIEYLSSHNCEAVHIFGYSMGGYVALYLARMCPERVKRVATLGTKFHWTPEVAAREVKLLDPRQIAEKVPRFAQTLQERHRAAGWETVLNRTAEMLTTLGAQRVLQDQDWSAISQRVRIGVGDRDATVSLEESIAVYRALPQCQLQVLPATPHPIERVPLEFLARSLIEFFQEQSGE